MKIKEKANKKILVTIPWSLEGIEELDVTDWEDRDLFDYMEDVDFGAAKNDRINQP